MNTWLPEIADDEVIARGICSPFHVKSNGMLKPEAYRAPPDTDEVSVMRANWIGADACKRRTKTLENPGENKIYRGLAILSAKQIRQSGASIVDTREIFEGHADIRHGIIERRGEPLPPEELRKLRYRLKALAALANYYPDPDSASEDWTGPPLCYKP